MSDDTASEYKEDLRGGNSLKRKKTNDLFFMF